MSEPDQPETGDLKRLVVVRMPFGKYKGRLIVDLPGAYLKGLITFST